MTEIARFPGSSTFIYNRNIFSVPEVINAYRNNGCDPGMVNITSYDFSQLRAYSGLRRNDRESWIDAELFLGLRSMGVEIAKEEVLVRRRVLLPSERRVNHFKRSDVAVVYLSSQVPGLIGLPRFVDATVNNSEHKSVYFITKREWHDLDKRGRQGVAELDDPCIMLLGEYQYLVSYPDQLDLWLEGAREKRQEDFPEFEEAMREQPQHN